MNGECVKQHDVVNGHIVEVSDAYGKSCPVVSRKVSLNERTGFGMFSYPVSRSGTLSLDSYDNSLTDAYADGINAIGAMKYGRATVERLPEPNGGRDFIFESKKRAGPTCEQRNRIGPVGPKKLFRATLSSGARWDWQMRELFVGKGFPGLLPIADIIDPTASPIQTGCCGIFLSMISGVLSATIRYDGLLQASSH